MRFSASVLCVAIAVGCGNSLPISVDGGALLAYPPDGGVVSDGGTSRRCADLASSYVKALQLAKGCNPTNRSPQCLAELPIAPGCSCTTFVEETHTPQAKQVLQIWSTSGCTGSCPLAVCAHAIGATCGGAGCQDISGPSSR
jgi:hypothetical protein